MKSSFQVSQGNLSRASVHAMIRTLAILVFVVTLPFGWRIFQPVNNIAIMVLGVNWLFESSLRYKVNLLKNSFIFYFLVAYYLVYAAGFLYSTNTATGLFVLEKKLPLIVFPLVFTLGTPITAKQLKTILSVFVFACLIATLICYVMAINLNIKEGHTISYIYNAIVNDKHEGGKYLYFNYWYFTNKLFVAPISMHPVYFAMYLVFSGCTAVYLWWKKNPRILKILLICLLSLNLLTIILLSSRTQLFCAVLFTTFYILTDAYRKKRMLLSFVTLIIIFGICLSFIWYNPILRERIIESNIPGTHFSENKFGEGGLSLRLFKWKYTIYAISEKPLFGYGTGDSQQALQNIYASNHFEIGVENNFNPHNQYLQSALDVGIAGIISFFLLLFIPLKEGIFGRNQLLILLATLFSISCLTESMLEVNKGISFYAFFCTFLIIAARSNIMEGNHSTASATSLL
jgi:O-antigen ligase